MILDQIIFRRSDVSFLERRREEGKETIFRKRLFFFFGSLFLSGLLFPSSKQKFDSRCSNPTPTIFHTSPSSRVMQGPERV